MANRNRVFLYLCGPFFGQFKDIHESPPASENSDSDASEDLQYKPKDYGKIEKKKRTFFRSKYFKASAGEGLAAAKRIHGWLPHLTTVTVESKKGSDVTRVQYEGVKARDISISDQMMKSLVEHRMLHTVELIHCHLKNLPHNLHELEQLRVLRLSYNQLTVLRKNAEQLESGKAGQLEAAILDWNRISLVEPGSFSEDMVKNLTVLNLAHNELEFLPSDFLLGAEQLRYLDLSFNRLKALPDSVLSCKKLQLLHMQHNDLVKLPARMESLTELRKLFVSYNRLTQLPEKIGKCRKLEKLRFVANHVRFLPDSAIELWKDRGGRLQECLANDNPLIQPSITAFEMGGLDQAFRLFHEWLETKHHEMEELADMSEGPIEAIRVPKITGMENMQAVGGGYMGDAKAMGASYTGGTKAGYSAIETPSEWSVPSPKVVPEEDRSSRARRISQSHHYYFSHLDQGKIDIGVAEIRSAESSLLLLKKSTYINNAKKLAMRKAAEAQALNKELPAHFKEILDPLVTAATFHGKVLVTDVDLYFILLVFSTKPLFITCNSLFDKFEHRDGKQHNDLHLTRAEWANLCQRVPVTLPEEVQQEMWNLLAWRDSSKITQVDFIAGWHIHDVEESDPWIKRLAAVLHLDYYDMDLDEMRERLKAKGAEEATPQLDFDGPSSDATKRGDVVNHLELQQTEGERWLAQNHAHQDRGYRQQRLKPPPQVSLGEVRSGLNDEDEGSNASLSDASISSGYLSRGSDSSDDQFDAQDSLREILARAKVEEVLKQAEMPHRTKFVVRSEEDLKKLMELSPKDILWQPQSAELFLRDERGKDALRTKKRPKLLRNATNIRDPRYKTDIFAVRQAIREAYRNLPHYDFVKLVNFILRGLRFIKHYNPEKRQTYWHADDPAFKHTMAVNRYTTQLLLQMGFICLNDTYWVWPSLHLKFDDTTSNWGSRVVPEQCPGMDKHRLDDMVHLFMRCQRGLANDGRNFTGHFHC
mmetsp:Transcript_7096/g.15284  ORF Transcript_7096/g.15284 Transcript_7096/m.15284 type:complete len:987 (-) Transcript_7096:113-3073(-)